MKGKAIIPLALGLCIGLIAVKFGVDAIRKAKGSVPAQETVKVVAAKVDIDAYQEITPEMVDLVETPDTALVPESERFTSIDDLKGRVTAKAIPQFAPVLATMLAPPGTPAGMVGRIPPGYRAVSVKIDEVTGVAYQIKPGDWVDVIVVMDIQSGGRGSKKQTIAEVILQNVQVAAIGQETNGQQGGGTAKVKPARSATLLVTDQEAPKLHLAATRGKITLAMRGDDDSAKSSSPIMMTDAEAFESIEDEKEPEPTQPPSRPAQVAQLEPEPDFNQPHSVVINRGSTTSGVAPIVERITFENAQSSNVIGINDGVAGGAGATFRAQPVRRQQRYEPPPRDDDYGADTDSDMPIE